MKGEWLAERRKVCLLKVEAVSGEEVRGWRRDDFIITDFTIVLLKKKKSSPKMETNSDQAKKKKDFAIVKKGNCLQIQIKQHLMCNTKTCNIFDPIYRFDQQYK